MANNEFPIPSGLAPGEARGYGQKPTVQDAVVLFRQQLYTSVQQERETIRMVDRAATEQVRRMEQMLIDRGKGQATQITEYAVEAEELVDQLKAIAKAANADEDIDLDEWSNLDGRHRQLVDLAVSTPDRVEELLESLEDPVKYLSDFQRRFPALNRPILR